MSVSSLRASEPDVHYPESDGKPMAETEIHRDEMMDTIAALKRRYRDAMDVYVGGNMLFYYVEGQPKHCVAPDVFVVHGVPKRKRRVYLLWTEGRSPSFVIEVTSNSTRREDLAKKKVLYERLGVEEYFLHDPLGEYLKPQLQGFRLADGIYQPIPREGDGSLASRTTGLRLRSEGENLRLLDATTGERLLWVDEVDTAREEAEAGRQEAEAGRQEAEASRQAAETDRQTAEMRLAKEVAVRRALEEELARLRGSGT